MEERGEPGFNPIKWRLMSSADKRAGETSRFLDYLGLWEDKTTAEHTPPDLISEKNYEPYDDGWPQNEEPSFTIH